MSQKLKTFFKSEEAGARITAYAFLIGLPSGILAFIGYEWIDWLVHSCVIAGIFGVVLHFIKNWRVIFRVDK
ncbi:MAG: hypothetical protein EAZ37_06945 [Burkholderiales bacterium]|nr:MAG: hypothetical protein EAZ37_06945 [Burkholderiales bacterium]